MPPQNTVVYQNQKRGFSRVKILVVALIAFLVILTIFVVTSSNGNKDTDTAKQFVTLIDQGKSADAYELLEKSFQSEEQFKRNFADPIRMNYKLGNCSYSQPKDKTGTTVVACPSSGYDSRMVLHIEVGSSKGSKITNYAIK